MKSISSTIEQTDGERVQEILVDQVPVGICIIQDSDFHYANYYFLNATGYTLDELMGRDSLEIVVPEDREMVRENTTRMLKGETLSPCQFRVICKDGSIIWVMVTFESIQYHGREAVLGNYTEVTEHKRLEDALKTNEERYRELADSITDVFFAMDEQLRYTYWNKASELLTKIRAEDAIGKSLLEIFPDSPGLRKAEKIYRAVLRTHKPRNFVNDFDIDGKHYIFEISAYPSRGGISVFVKDVTEHKQADEARQVEKNKLESIIDALQEAITILDRDYNILYQSKAAARTGGYHLGEKCYRAFEGKDKVCDGCAVAEAFKDGKSHTSETRIVTLWGEVRLLENTANPIRDAKGKVVSCVEVTRDITERKHIEGARKEAEEERNALLEEAPVGIMHTDLKGKVIYINKRFESESGYSRDEIVGKNGFRMDWLPAGTMKQLAKRMDARLKGRPGKHWETQFKCKDGRWIWVELEGKVLRKLGVPVGFQVVARDTTERKRAEEALNLQRAYFQQLFDSSPDAIIILDINGKLNHANKGFEILFGYSFEELKGRSPRKLIIPEEDAHESSTALHAVFSGEIVRKETVRKRKDGSLVDVSVLAYPIRVNEKLVGAYFIYTDITQRKQAEEALQNERNKLQSLVDAMEETVTIRDTEYNVIYQNEPSLIRSGGDRRGEKCYRAFEDRDKVCEGCPVEKAFKDGKSHTAVRSVKISGKVTFWENIANPIMDVEGRIISCLEIGRDITERKQAEEALRESEEFSTSLLDNAPNPVTVVNPDTSIRYINPAFETMTGFSLAEITGIKAPYPWWPEETIERRLTNMRGAISKCRKKFKYEETLQNKKGERFWIELTSSSIMSNGKVKYHIANWLDITERKQAEEALKQSEEKYKALFDSTLIGMIVVNPEALKLVMANQAAAIMFGFSSANEITGVNLLDFVPLEDKDRMRKYFLEEFFEQDLRRTHELRMIAKDGSERWISANGTRIMHEDRLAGLACFTDITEQKQQNERLMMTDRLASLGELASGAAHELNNPLTSIIGFSQLLMEKEVPDDIHEELKLINNEARRAVVVTNNFLSFARRHSSTKQLNQINNIIEDVLELRAHEHKVNHIDVERHLATNLPEIMVDYFQMQQVFMNIIINAEYFMVKMHNKGTLTITTEKENSTLRVVIADDGPGITPENLKRIFDPFFTTKEAGSGTGLGLSICHGIVNDHGGQIYATSQLGKGTTVVMELPMKKRARMKSLV